MQLRDDVTCNWCDKQSLVPAGEDKCPHCATVGCLRWTDENAPEVEPS